MKLNLVNDMEHEGTLLIPSRQVFGWKILAINEISQLGSGNPIPSGKGCGMKKSRSMDFFSKDSTL